MPVSEQRIIEIMSPLLPSEVIESVFWDSFLSRLIISHRLTKALRAELPDYPWASVSVSGLDGDTVILSVCLSRDDPVFFCNIPNGSSSLEEEFFTRA